MCPISEAVSVLRRAAAGAAIPEGDGEADNLRAVAAESVLKGVRAQPKRAERRTAPAAALWCSDTSVSLVTSPKQQKPLSWHSAYGGRRHSPAIQRVQASFDFSFLPADSLRTRHPTACPAAKALAGGRT